MVSPLLISLDTPADLCDWPFMPHSVGSSSYRISPPHVCLSSVKCIPRPTVTWVRFWGVPNSSLASSLGPCTYLFATSSTELPFMICGALASLVCPSSRLGLGMSSLFHASHFCSSSCEHMWQLSRLFLALGGLAHACTFFFFWQRMIFLHYRACQVSFS